MPRPARCASPDCDLPAYGNGLCLPEFRAALAGTKDTSYDQLTKAQLLDLATVRDVEGRSSMDKAELIAALSADDDA